MRGALRATHRVLQRGLARRAVALCRDERGALGRERARRGLTLLCKRRLEPCDVAMQNVDRSFQVFLR